MIRRAFYSIVLRMHPRSFREQFAAEMLWVFDEAERASQSSGFCLDAVRSLVRQWLCRPWIWKIAGAATGPLLTFWMGAKVVPQPPSDDRGIDLGLVVAAGALILVCLAVILSVESFRAILRRGARRAA